MARQETPCLEALLRRVDQEFGVVAEKPNSQLPDERLIRVQNCLSFYFFVVEQLAAPPDELVLQLRWRRGILRLIWKAHETAEDFPSFTDYRF